ncbi:hypothetical protein GCM10028807_50170 [Spirosoma daeguense]
MKANTYSGLEIKQLLQSRGVSVRQMAEMLEVTAQSVYEILRKPEVKRSTALKFYDALDVQIPDSKNLINKDIKESKENYAIYSPEYIEELKAIIAEQKEELKEQREELKEKTRLLSQLAQSNAALIEKLGKFSASGLLAGYDA